MASLEKRGDRYRVVFRFGGRKFGQSLKTKSDKAAAASLARLEDNLRRAELGTLSVPDNADVAAFLLSDGKSNGRPRPAPVFTLKDLCERYLDGLPAGTVEDSTLRTMRLHLRHVRRLLGDRFSVGRLTLEHLQSYVDKRSKEDGLRGRKVCATTIKKDLVTFGGAWSWAVLRGFVVQPFPKRGLRFSKIAEKPPFQTWQEIERKIGRGGLTDAEQADLWDCLFLTLSEVADLLSFVKVHAREPFLYPMFAFAAHTGARRSEMMRSQIDDIDFVANTVTLHEKKRMRGKTTTRQVPLSPFLHQVLENWLSVHPGGQHTFCHVAKVVRCRTERQTILPLTPDEAHDHFKRTLAESKWAKVRGWHLFRHSFCSNCAAAGVDQRLINGWVGHQTEEMVRRYRHLLPDQQQSAIVTVFGRVGQEPLISQSQ